MSRNLYDFDQREFRIFSKDLIFFLQPIYEPLKRLTGLKWSYNFGIQSIRLIPSNQRLSAVLRKLRKSVYEIINCIAVQEIEV